MATHVVIAPGQKCTVRLPTCDIEFDISEFLTASQKSILQCRDEHRMEGSVCRSLVASTTAPYMRRTDWLKINPVNFYVFTNASECVVGFIFCLLVFQCHHSFMFCFVFFGSILCGRKTCGKSWTLLSRSSGSYSPYKDDITCLFQAFATGGAVHTRSD